MNKTDFAEKRTRLLKEIQDEARQTRKWTGRAAFDGKVMAALARVPRHEFMSPKEVAFSYVNRPYAIGHGQTISQPYIVALMTDLLDIQSHHRILEVGTGSGYQTAVLASLANRVYSVEIIPQLADAARSRLARLGYGNVSLNTGDGGQGWAAEAPFDGIMVTAAALEMPPCLPEQLAPGGRLVIPLGETGGEQRLMLGLKDADGAIEIKSVLAVAFVPLVDG
jgi:protein-L-isoaspartate(D-aspartate) O-methyltransferase